MDYTEIKDAEVYCGTYKKYNDGSLYGKWLKLADYDSKGEFYAACRELHKDEDDPEFMFQDRQYIPDSLCGESWIDERVWELLEMDDDDLEILSSWLDNYGVSDDTDFAQELESAKENYYGRFRSDEDFAESFEDTLDIPNHLRNYIDWKSYARDLMISDFFESNGLYFSCC